MYKRKDLVILVVLFTLFLGGCCKKNKEVAFSDFDSEQTMASSEIPVFKDGIEDFFVDDEVSQYAFLDDDEFSEEDLKSEDLEKLSLNEFVDEESFLEEDSFVAWDEDAEEGNTAFKIVHFDLNQNNIRRDQEQLVEENIEAAKYAVEEGKTIIVQGHTCQLGSPSYNIPLSERRADVIKKEMVKRGIPENKIKTIGFGEEIPLVWSDKENKTELIKELGLNRRAEIVLGS